MSDDFSWEDVRTVTIQDRTQLNCQRAVSDTTSTSESDVGEEWLELETEALQMEGDKGPLSLDDLFGDEKRDVFAEVDLPTVEEAEAQLCALRKRRERIVAIAQRYTGDELPSSKTQAKVTDPELKTSPTVNDMVNSAAKRRDVESDLCAKVSTGGYQSGDPGMPCMSATEQVLQHLRREGLRDDRKIQEGLVKDQERAEELWRGFLCDDMPVGGDFLPNPDEFYRKK